jgi:5-(carboxyamino)imidazole ribonucleotide synthase
MPVVGMVGAGQLARMTHQAAISLGMSLRVLATSRREPAALVAADVVLGEPTDPVALREFVRGCHAVTFDHENVPAEHLRALAGAGVPLRPNPDALLHAQDKLVMRRRLTAMGVRVPPFRQVHGLPDVVGFAAEHGWPVVLKTSRGGYDGRGTWVLADADRAAELLPGLHGLPHGPVPLLVEQHVTMRRELAVQVARSPFGQAAVWPVVHTVQRDGICVQVVAPAPDLPTATAFAAQQLALRIAAELDVIGLLAVELFDAPEGLVVNELAMRPHNSGHWTIEGSTTSQFEQHLRAVLDYPLGVTTPTAPVTVMSNILGAATTPAMGIDERVHHAFARFPDLRLHLYGKAERPGRKIGHVTVLGAQPAELRRRADLAAGWLAAARWPDGWSIH